MQKWGLPTNTKRFFNLVVALGATLLVIWVFVMAQTQTSGPDTQQYTPEQQARVDSLRKALGRDITTRQQDPTQNMWDNMLWVLLVLGGGLAALWWWNRSNDEPHEVRFTIVGQFEVGPGQAIKIVDMGGEYWILGVTSNGITLLEKWTEQQWEQRKPKGGLGPGQTSANFEQLFNRFKSSKS
jgi:flagellar biogenesis protein FliO